MHLKEPGGLQVTRNTQTLQAYRARMQAATRAAMPFFVLPTLFNPAIYLPLFRRSSLHMSSWAIIATCIVWCIAMCGSLAIGVQRKQKYLQTHPFNDNMQDNISTCRSSPPGRS